MSSLRNYLNIRENLELYSFIKSKYGIKTKSHRKDGPFFLRLLARLQKYLGDYFGSSPGAEMIVATNIANSIGAKLAFIDKPILQTIQGA